MHKQSLHGTYTYFSALPNLQVIFGRQACTLVQASYTPWYERTRSWYLTFKYEFLRSRLACKLRMDDRYEQKLHGSGWTLSQREFILQTAKWQVEPGCCSVTKDRIYGDITLLRPETYSN